MADPEAELPRLHHFSEEQQDDFKEAFSLYDPGNSGQVSEKEVFNAIG